MPGTILVTVLELMELQLPSASTSSSPGEANKVFVKVSHGKREYRTAPHIAEGNRRDVVWESSVFSFPVFNLRDSLSISVLDCNENEIGRADIKSHSIIEKGMWDDMFPLKGGGSVRLKLQFVLSDAERQRIQTMERILPPEIRAAALKKKEVGPLKESVPEVCVEKVPSVEYETSRSAPDVILSSQKIISESPYLQSDQSMSSTPLLSIDIKNCEDSVPGYLSKHEEPYLEKSQLSKPEVTPKGNLRKVKEMIQAFESTTTMEPKHAKLSKTDSKFNMSEADSDAQYSWKVESRIRDSCMIQKNSGALYNVDVQKRYIKFRTETGNKDTKSFMEKLLRNGKEEDFLQNFVEMEIGDRKSNQEPSESVGSLPLYLFSSNYQESPVMHRQMEHTIFESLTDYITCGEMRYLCLTAENEQVKNLLEIYMTSEKCTLQKNSGITQADEKGFLDYRKDSCCQKKSSLDKLMGAIDLMDGFLKQTIRIALVVACGTLFFNIGRKTR